jgi:hypothetical protein
MLLTYTSEKGLLLRRGRQGKKQPYRQYEESQRVAKSHRHLARLSRSEKIMGRFYHERSEETRRKVGTLA